MHGERLQKRKHTRDPGSGVESCVISLNGKKGKNNELKGSQSDRFRRLGAQEGRGEGLIDGNLGGGGLTGVGRGPFLGGVWRGRGRGTGGVA